MATPISPTDLELSKAIENRYSKGELQTVGVKKVVAYLKASDAPWNASDTINAKRVKEILQDLRLQQDDGAALIETPSNRSGQDNGGSIECSSDRCSADKALFIAAVSEFDSNRPEWEAEVDIMIESLKETTTTICRKKHALTSLPWLADLYIDSVGYIQNATQGSELPAKLAQTHGTPEKVGLLAQVMFYVEWRQWLGPDSKESMAPKCEFVDGQEAKKFQFLSDCYLGPDKHPESFENYAVGKLQSKRFQQTADWLLWALTMTEDRDLFELLNMILLTCHSFKTRHLGGGITETLMVDVEFFPMELSEDGTKLVMA